jgi:hypothetical protein
MTTRLPDLAQNGHPASKERLPLSGVKRTNAQQQKVAPMQALPARADYVELTPTMCGRFTQGYTWQEIRDLYDLTGTALNLEPRYNIAPTQQIDVVYVPDDKTLPAKMRWGLIPPWWKKTARDATG